MRIPKRSWSVWVLMIGYVMFSSSGFIRLVGSIVDWYWLTFSGMRPGPLYLAVTGALWCCTGLVALVWLWFRLPWNRLVAAGAAVLFVIYYWGDRLLINNPDARLDNAGFALFLTGLGLIFVLLVLEPWQVRLDRKDSGYV